MKRVAAAGLTVSLAFLALNGYSAFLVDPLVRYQKYIGVGGTAGSGTDNNWYIGDMGATVLRVHLDGRIRPCRIAGRTGPQCACDCIFRPARPGGCRP